MKTPLLDRLSILFSLIGTVAFGVGVTVTLIQGGFTAICFAIAMLCGTLIFCFDVVRPARKATQVKSHADTHSCLQPSH